MPVVGRTLLLSVGLADRTVHIEDEFAWWLPLVDLVDPLAGELHQPCEVAPVAKYVDRPKHCFFKGLAQIACQSVGNQTEIWVLRKVNPECTRWILLVAYAWDRLEFQAPDIERFFFQSTPWHRF